LRIVFALRWCVLLVCKQRGEIEIERGSASRSVRRDRDAKGEERK
jgi:hypothetical protein